MILWFQINAGHGWTELQASAKLEQIRRYIIYKLINSLERQNCYDTYYSIVFACPCFRLFTDYEDSHKIFAF